MNLSYNHGRSEKGHCVSPFPSVVADSEPRQSAWWAGMWQRTLLPIFIAGSGSLTAALTHFCYFWESYRLPGAQNSKKVFMVLIPQCCSWSEWLYFECSPSPGKTRCSIYDQCIFSRPSLDCLTVTAGFGRWSLLQISKYLTSFPHTPPPPFWQAVSLCFSSS